MFLYMGIAVISDRFFYFVSVVLFSATQPQTSGLFWQLFLHPFLKPQSEQHTLPRLRSQLKILHFLAFDFSIFFHPLFLLFLFVFFTQPMFHKLYKPTVCFAFFTCSLSHSAILASSSANSSVDNDFNHSSFVWLQNF